MAAKKALELIEKQYNVTELLQLLIELDGKAADSECHTFLETLLYLWNTARLAPEKLDEVMESIA